MHKKNLAIITTHPVQYNAPLFKVMAQSQNFNIKVFYTWGQAKGKVYDPGFGQEREWDIPLLDGYEYNFVENVSTKPGSHHFKGIINPTLIKEIEAYQPDAVLVIGWSFESHLKVMRYFYKKIPVLFRGDSNLLDEPKGWSLKKTARRFFLRWVYRHVDYALYVGEANKAYFLKAGLKEKQLIFAPHAVNNVFFYDVDGSYEKEAREWRRELGINENELVFLFAGKLEPKKDPELLVSAFTETDNGSCKLIMTGNGILEHALKQYTKNNERIIFLPFQNQRKMPVLYRMADVFVLPSKGPGETWGLAVNEAMACARPVLVSDRCGCAADLVEEGKNGYVFKSGNSDDLKLKLNLFVKKKESLIKMGVISRDKIAEWSYEKITMAISDVLKKETTLCD